MLSPLINRYICTNVQCVCMCRMYGPHVPYACVYVCMYHMHVCMHVQYVCISANVYMPRVRALKFGYSFSLKRNLPNMFSHVIITPYEIQTLLFETYHDF